MVKPWGLWLGPGIIRIFQNRRVSGISEFWHLS